MIHAGTSIWENVSDVVSGGLVFILTVNAYVDAVHTRTVLMVLYKCDADSLINPGLVSEDLLAFI